MTVANNLEFSASPLSVLIGTANAGQGPQRPAHSMLSDRQSVSPVKYRCERSKCLPVENSKLAILKIATPSIRGAPEDLQAPLEMEVFQCLGPLMLCGPANSLMPLS